jgi:hypothetical protein
MMFNFSFPNPNNKYRSVGTTNTAVSEQQIPQCRNNKYRSVGTFPNFNRKTVQRAKLDTFSTHMYNCSHTWISIGTSIKIGGFKLVLWVQTSPFNKKINAVMQVFSTCE